MTRSMVVEGRGGSEVLASQDIEPPAAVEGGCAEAVLAQAHLLINTRLGMGDTVPIHVLPLTRADHHLQTGMPAEESYRSLSVARMTDSEKRSGIAHD